MYLMYKEIPCQMPVHGKGCQVPCHRPSALAPPDRYTLLMTLFRRASTPIYLPNNYDSHNADSDKYYHEDF